MNPATETRPEWACGDCGVTSRRMGGGPAPLPRGWVRDGAAARCLSCERGRVREAGTDEERSRLVDAELRRDPSDLRRIEWATGATRRQVRDARLRLRRAGELGARKAARRPSPRAEQRARAEAELRRDPARPDVEIARAAGVGQGTAKRARDRLGIAPHRPHQDRRREDAAALRRLGGATVEEFAEAAGASVCSARNRLMALLHDGEATRRRGQAVAYVFEPAEDGGPTPAPA